MRAVVRSPAVLAAAVALLAPAVARAGPPQIVRPLDEPGKPLLQLGEELYAGNCVSCHGVAGSGNPAPQPHAGATTIQELGPPLRGVGAQAADFYLRTGYMPLGSAHDQPVRSPSPFSSRERQAIVSYVASLGGGPPVPRPDPGRGDIATGRELFTEHCAGCHQVAAEGGIMIGAKAPPLDRASATEIAEAVRIGPYVMPKFSTRDISDDELNAIIAYVEYTKNPRDAGGWGIDHLGPFPEGMVTWFLAAVVLVATCMAIGKRATRP
jgi:ubiquinol-cytochrome c reductase cytochrome c subunit